MQIPRNCHTAANLHFDELHRGTTKYFMRNTPGMGDCSSKMIVRKWLSHTIEYLRKVSLHEWGFAYCRVICSDIYVHQKSTAGQLSGWSTFYQRVIVCGYRYLSLFIQILMSSPYFIVWPLQAVQGIVANTLTDHCN